MFPFWILSVLTLFFFHVSNSRVVFVEREIMFHFEDLFQILWPEKVITSLARNAT